MDRHMLAVDTATNQIIHKNKSKFCDITYLCINIPNHMSNITGDGCTDFDKKLNMATPA